VESQGLGSLPGSKLLLARALGPQGQGPWDQGLRTTAKARAGPNGTKRPKARAKEPKGQGKTKASQGQGQFRGRDPRALRLGARAQARCQPLAHLGSQEELGGVSRSQDIQGRPGEARRSQEEQGARSCWVLPGAPKSSGLLLPPGGSRVLDAPPKSTWLLLGIGWLHLVPPKIIIGQLNRC
jgi:hypothetical protein